MVIDAIVLAGGRSSRLGNVPKAGLAFRNRTLLQHAVDAVGFARATVVVGEGDLPAGVVSAREEPPFGGPAAGIAAGLDRLRGFQQTPADFTLVLACDMPSAAAATAALRRALVAGVDSDGLIAVDDAEHPQPLAALYRTAGLASAVAEQGGQLHGLSVFRLISKLSLTPIAVPSGSTDDVDTWEDAARFAIARPGTLEEK